MPKKRKPPKHPHATEAQTKRRIDELLRLRLDGAEIHDILEYSREKVAAKDPVWGRRALAESTLYGYMARVKEKMAELGNLDQSAKDALCEHLAIRRNLMAKAIGSGDYRAALACARDEAELRNLYPSAKSPDTAANRTGPSCIVLAITETIFIQERPQPLPIGAIVEEVITHANGTANGHAGKDHPPPPGPTELPS